MQTTEDDFRQRHAAAWASDHLIQHTEAEFGKAVLKTERWRKVAPHLPDTGAILEIGPGTGQVIAAAKREGRYVAGVETSQIHRKYIEDTWGITSTYESLEQLPSEQRFSGIIIMNTIEHMVDPQLFMRKLAALLEPAGAIFVSTCSADSLCATVCGTKWSMCKQLDHFSFPSARGMREMAARVGLKATRVWTHELPFETLLSIGVAIRDWTTDARIGSVAHNAASEKEPRVHPLMKISRIARPIDVFTPVLSFLGLASSIRAVLVRDQI